MTTMSISNSFIIIIIIAGFFCPTYQYKPVIYMHGILGDAAEGDFLLAAIKKAHPETEVTSIDCYNDLASTKPMWEQVNNISKVVKPMMDKHPEGINIICYSQGGLICRGLLSTLEHNVDTFVALSSPLAGQFGDTDYLKFLFPNYIKNNIYKYFYTIKGQRWSVANYWRDPHQTELYHKYSSFLYQLNSGANKSYKENFLRLKKLVFIGGPNDGVITPWQSSHLAFYDAQDNIVEMKDQAYYLNDAFGLKTLDQRGGVVTHVIPGVKHTHWYRNQTVFDSFILPYLK